MYHTVVHMATAEWLIRGMLSLCDEATSWTKVRCWDWRWMGSEASPAKRNR